MKTIEVVAAIIFNPEQNQILISKRPDHLHKGGYWEFPGGKVDAGESFEQALCRELKEELAISVQESDVQSFESLEYDYPEKSVHLHFYKVYGFAGEPNGQEGQLWQWVDLKQLPDYQFPEANEPIVDRLLATH